MLVTPNQIELAKHMLAEPFPTPEAEEAWVASAPVDHVVMPMEDVLAHVRRAKVDAAVSDLLRQVEQ